ncbi:hypothetical protein GTP46_08385 [Duganella sp. FT135W]|uniref:Uncharacterized protein n=1 Tax=Duganella flavida TaxID=2692175 RepID=A0A6L8K9T5_9BURK|nr:hypothetical protein [Duganella flavida]MYM22662.1 hypothetical protein [Duganella flavida]
MTLHGNSDGMLFDGNDRTWVRLLEWLLIETLAINDTVGSRLLMAKMVSIISDKFCVPETLLEELTRGACRLSMTYTQREKIAELNRIFSEFEDYLVRWSGIVVDETGEAFRDETWRMFTHLKMRFFY